jgi:hypothetical protein
MLEEVYAALQSGLTRLATIGIRAVLEHVMIGKVGDRGSFGQNLKAFQEAGFVSPLQAHARGDLEAGRSDASHHNPTPAELTTLVDIAEGLIEAIIFPIALRKS